MNDQELDEAAYLVLQKVKVTLAIIIIKSTPENLNVKNYAAMFQDKFRKHASRVNLHLEKKLFHEQLLLLLPAFRVSPYQEVGDFCEPMDVDVEDDISDTVLQSKFQLRSNENDQFHTNMINSLSRFLDALIKAELLSKRSEMIARNDVTELLLTCEEAGVPYPSRQYSNEDTQHFTGISSNLLKYVMRSVNVIKITSECVSTIVNFLRKYLRILNTKFVSHESVAAVRYANEVLLKYTKNFSQNKQSTSFIIEFVRASTQDFFELSSSECTCRCWFAMFGCWRQSESACAAEINALFGVIKTFSDLNSRLIGYPLEDSCEHLLEVLKRMLSSYAKLNLPETKSVVPKNGPSEKRSRCIEKPAELRRLDISHWEKMMRNVILECISKKQPIIQAGWTCLKIIMLMKCQLKPKNSETPSNENRLLQ